MKKVISILCIVVLASATIFAGTFSGKTEVAVNYSYRDDAHLAGLTVNNSGYCNDSHIGYAINVNADFDTTTWNCDTITMLIGPSYRVSVKETGLNLEIALGLSATGENITTGDTKLLVGAGSYVGAGVTFSNGLSLALGASVGLDLFSIPLDGNKPFYQGVTFQVTPSVGLAFNY